MERKSEKKFNQARKMKIGIYGGAFNPIHLGHEQLVREFIKRLALDRLLLIPSAQSPHKSSSKLILASNRLDMCSLVAESLENCEVCDMEILRGGTSFTYQTILELKKVFPDDKLYLLCGSDMFLTLEKWKNPEIIYSNVVVCGVKRGNEQEDSMLAQKLRLEALGATVIVENFFIQPYSSTVVRAAISEGKPFEYMLNDNVVNYIKQNKLYGYGG